MSQSAQAITRPPADVIREAPVSQAPNGICYAVSGEMSMPGNDVERMISAVPKAIAAALARKAYYFVPLTVNQGEQTVIADRYDVALSDAAVCHRNLDLGGSQCVFISTRLMDDKFSIAFEFYINVGHALVERAWTAVRARWGFRPSRLAISRFARFRSVRNRRTSRMCRLVSVVWF